jgi:hypothetical protein
MATCCRLTIEIKKDDLETVSKPVMNGSAIRFYQEPCMIAEGEACAKRFEDPEEQRLVANEARHDSALIFLTYNPKSLEALPATLALASIL